MSEHFLRYAKCFEDRIRASEKGESDKDVPMVYAEGRIFVHTGSIVLPFKEALARTEEAVHLLTGIKPLDQRWGDIVAVDQERQLLNCKINGPGNRVEGVFPNILVEAKDIIWLC